MTHDDDARVAIRERLGDTMLVEAGAGTGKTSALVDRVVALVASSVPIERIAAITFTEQAAAELRDRVRGGLEEAQADAGVNFRHYVRLAQRAREGWRALEAEIGEDLISHTGSLDIGETALDVASALDECGVPFEILDARAVEARWPIALDAGEPALFQPLMSSFPHSSDIMRLTRSVAATGRGPSELPSR